MKIQVPEIIKILKEIDVEFPYYAVGYNKDTDSTVYVMIEENKSTIISKMLNNTVKKFDLTVSYEPMDKRHDWTDFDPKYQSTKETFEDIMYEFMSFIDDIFER